MSSVPEPGIRSVKSRFPGGLRAAAVLTLVGITAGACSGSSRSPAGASTSADATALRSIVTAPIQVAHTTDGTVSYRSIGSGTPLVMIMGYSSSMDGWPPVFVDALALHHQVVVFDNAGIGQTSPLPGALSMSSMADQTDAFILSLHLHKPAVLGWSMGGMIAQALAVRHPNDVGKLILSATMPGNGKATPPSASTIAVLGKPSHSNAVGLESLLFPADQQAKQVPAFTAQVAQYPHLYLAPSSVDSAQFSALGDWFAGHDPSGPGIDQITVPTLIGDGKEDALIPVANADALQTAIRHSRLVLYPDAGHGFVFQDAADWAKQIDSFIGS